MNMDACRLALSSKKTSSSERVAASERESTSSVNRVDDTEELTYKKRLLSALCGVSNDCLNKDGQVKSLMKFGSRESSSNASSSFMVAADPFEVDFLRSYKRSAGAASSDSLTRRHMSTSQRVMKDSPVTCFDLPGIADDFYRHPLSWSNDNVLAVVLGDGVYLWNAESKKVVRLLNQDKIGRGSFVTVVKWCSLDGLARFLAIGTLKDVRVYDTVMGRLVYLNESGRRSVGSMTWNKQHQWLTVGYEGGNVLNLDIGRHHGVVNTFRSSSPSASQVCIMWFVYGMHRIRVVHVSPLSDTVVQ